MNFTEKFINTKDTLISEMKDHKLATGLFGGGVVLALTLLASTCSGSDEKTSSANTTFQSATTEVTLKTLSTGVQPQTTEPTLRILSTTSTSIGSAKNNEGKFLPPFQQGKIPSVTVEYLSGLGSVTTARKLTANEGFFGNYNTPLNEDQRSRLAVVAGHLVGCIDDPTKGFDAIRQAGRQVTVTQDQFEKAWNLTTPNTADDIKSGKIDCKIFGL